MVSAEHRIEPAAAPTSPVSGFAEWNRALDERFEVIGNRRGSIPRSILRYSPAVARFAESYSRAYGEWVWSPVYGDAWRPYDNDYYPGADWQPYRYGRWRDISGDLFWVPDEAWGWVPYHLGFWVWDPELGWIWVPGRYFAPAWVSWFGYQGLVAWRPWGFWDWYLLTRTSCAYGLSHRSGSCACRPPSSTGGTAVPRPGRPSPPRGEGDGDEPRRPPLEHRRAYDRLVARLRQGDESARVSLEATARHLVVGEAELKVGPIRETISLGRDLSEDV